MKGVFSEETDGHKNRMKNPKNKPELRKNKKSATISKLFRQKKDGGEIMDKSPEWQLRSSIFPMNENIWIFWIFDIPWREDFEDRGTKSSLEDMSCRDGWVTFTITAFAVPWTAGMVVLPVAPNAGMLVFASCPNAGMPVFASPLNHRDGCHCQSPKNAPPADIKNRKKCSNFFHSKVSCWKPPAFKVLYRK